MEACLQAKEFTDAQQLGLPGAQEPIDFKKNRNLKLDSENSRAPDLNLFLDTWVILQWINSFCIIHFPSQSSAAQQTPSRVIFRTAKSQNISITRTWNLTWMVAYDPFKSDLSCKINFICLIISSETFWFQQKSESKTRLQELSSTWS